MLFKTKTISGYNSYQIAYPVGPNKDSYTITSLFTQDINTLEIIVKHELIKNWVYKEKDPNIKYKEGDKFKEILFEGTYKECQNFFINNIIPIEWEWIYDDKLNPIYPEQNMIKY